MTECTICPSPENPDVIACAHFEGSCVRIWQYRDEWEFDGERFEVIGPEPEDTEVVEYIEFQRIETGIEQRYDGETYYSREEEQMAWIDFHRRETILLCP